MVTPELACRSYGLTILMHNDLRYISSGETCTIEKLKKENSTDIL